MICNLNVHKPNYAKAALEKMDDKTKKEIKEM